MTKERKIDFVKELTWRGMIHDIMPGTQQQLQKEMTAAYVGIDPTAESLHIGHLVSVMLLKHFQLAGHKPILLVGGATGMIGDPSGRSEERALLDEKTIRHNQETIKKQLVRLLNFDDHLINRAELVNNYDWMKEFSVLDFLRDVGKHLTINYMMAKDSVKSRLETGLSFTEFSYQLVQAYDFYHLFLKKDCKLQMGGSDQWGNITAGTELIRRKASVEAFALTCPLITKSDGKKFGKTEQGNVWLDSKLTSPYRFVQFWLNVSDEDAEKYIKIFTLLKKNDIEELIREHRENPHLRTLQKKLAQEITTMVHSIADFKTAMENARILFGNSTTENLKKLSTADFLDVFEGVPVNTIDHNQLKQGQNILKLLAVTTAIFPSKGEARRLIKAGGVSLNKTRVTDPELLVTGDFLLNNKFLLVQKGKKNYYLIKVED